MVQCWQDMVDVKATGHPRYARLVRDMAYRIVSSVPEYSALGLLFVIYAYATINADVFMIESIQNPIECVSKRESG